MRLLAICRLCPQACTKTPPPPWELLVMDRPSMLDGLHWKLLENGLAGFVLEVAQSVLVSKTVPKGIWLSVATRPVSARVPKTSTPAGKRTPFERTVIPAPS